MKVTRCPECRDRGWMIRDWRIVLCACEALGSLMQAAWCASRLGIVLGTRDPTLVQGIGCPQCGNRGTRDPLVVAESQLLFHAILGADSEAGALLVSKHADVPAPGEGSDRRLLCMRCSHEWALPPIRFNWIDPTEGRVLRP